jgi:hypothetical protein
VQLSTRAFHRVLKLSRTIADLAGSDAIRVTHLAEALQYRPRRQDAWRLLQKTISKRSPVTKPARACPANFELALCE